MILIYVGLKKLNKKGLIEFEDLGEKLGKGFMLIWFVIMEVGMIMLRNEVIVGLFFLWEWDKWFDFGFVVLFFIDKDEVIEVLWKWLDFFGEVLERIK